MKKETKELGMETCPKKGVIKEKFPNSRKPSHQWVCEEFWNLRGQHNQEGEKKPPQNRHLTTTSSGEVAQMLASTTSERRMDREVRAASLALRISTGPECLEDNLRELT